MACTVNEEHGYSGAQALTRLWTAAGNDSIVPRTPDMAVIAEPTNLDVVVGAQGSGALAHATRMAVRPTVRSRNWATTPSTRWPESVGVGKLRPRRARLALGPPALWPAEPERGRHQWRSERKHRAGSGDDRNRSSHHSGRGWRNRVPAGRGIRQPPLGIGHLRSSTSVHISKGARWATALTRHWPGNWSRRPARAAVGPRKLACPLAPSAPRSRGWRAKRSLRAGLDRSGPHVRRVAVARRACAASEVLYRFLSAQRSECKEMIRRSHASASV